MNTYIACWTLIGFWFVISCLCKGKLTGDDKEDTDYEN